MHRRPLTSPFSIHASSLLQEEVAIKIIDLEQFNTNWDEIRVR